MSNTIKLRRSAVSGSIPTTGQLALGEVAINTFDGKLFIKKDDGTASIVEIGAGGGSLSSLSDTDLTTNTPASGDYLAYDGTSWIPVGWGDAIVTAGGGVTTGTLSTFPMLGSSSYYANAAAMAADGFTVISGLSNADDVAVTFNPGATFTGIDFLGLGTSSANWFVNSNGGVGFDFGGNSTNGRSGNALLDAASIDLYVSWWSDDTASQETGWQIYNDGSNDWLVVHSEQKVFYSATTGYVVEAWFRDDGNAIKVLYSDPNGTNYFTVGANRNCIVNNGSDAISAAGLGSSNNPFSNLTNQSNYGILVSTTSTVVDAGGLLSRLNDVDLTTVAPTNGDVIAYNSTSGYWEPTAQGGGGAGSAVSATAPVSPSNGDFWYNLNTGTQLIYVDDGNSQQWVDVASGTGGIAYTIGSTAPSAPNVGDMWFDTDVAIQYTYVDDGNSSQWIETGNSSSSSSSSGLASTASVNVFSAGQIGAVTTLTDQATIATDLALSNNFEITLGGNRLFDNPTNMVAGQVGSIFISQDATGSRTLSWGSYWLFSGGTAPTLSTAALAQDRIDYIVKSSTEIHAQFSGDFR